MATWRKEVCKLGVRSLDTNTSTLPHTALAASNHKPHLDVSAEVGLLLVVYGLGSLAAPVAPCRSGILPQILKVIEHHLSSLF